MVSTSNGSVVKYNFKLWVMPGRVLPVPSREGAPSRLTSEKGWGFTFQPLPTHSTEVLWEDSCSSFPSSFTFKDFIYSFLERGEEKEKERERNINVWLPLVRPLLGTWPQTQACALTGNRTSDPFLACRQFLAGEPAPGAGGSLW